MIKKKRIQKVLSLLLMVFLLIGMLPGVLIAAEEEGEYITLRGLEFVSEEDSTLILGEPTTVNLKLNRIPTSKLFTGGVNATLTDPDGKVTHYSVSGGSGYYNINNVILYTPGDYTLKVSAVAPNKGSATGIIKVLDAVTTVTNPLVVNKENSIIVKLTDSNGNILPQRSVTVDGSDVDASPANQSYTTLNDGTFVLKMTPTKAGNVNIIFSGKVIGTIPVNSAFEVGDRIGSLAMDNVALSVEVAKQGWSSAANVILARDDQFSDSLAAAPLSKKLDAPILMTGSSTLDSRTLAGIRELGARNIYIVGGTVAISQSIEDTLSKDFTVTRIAGQQGYDTAALISAQVGIDPSQTVYLANGHAIPDAIAISAFAGAQGNPILLTNRDVLPASTLQALVNLGASNVVLLGGTAVISSSVENQLNSNYLVKRWGGYERYDTQSIIFQNLLDKQAPQSPLYFTSGLVRQDDVSWGKPYADALLTAALAAKNGGFVAMTQPNTIPSGLNYYLLFNKGYISKSVVVGNNRGVSYNLEQQLQQLLKH
ncbi:cell wall-binding repeat-containing protein [Desulfosporosinus sp.]|uniref:cell wall-binding repeat-containing protein n=1 Tax=Desulfosporosinus sp. TaxID=157907 RepID=UPI0025BBF96A|nr:cell wall-binding repeat-containing protein [Desulfosporosinus sp.]MBC2721716.1 cell wall-binding repeat-containing protein [Desulfosporosinus sp.]MBC2726326.1 cell wall-binding repeat-containing protein [Desulfosporosinus sp.]